MHRDRMGAFTEFLYPQEFICHFGVGTCAIRTSASPHFVICPPYFSDICRPFFLDAVASLAPSQKVYVFFFILMQCLSQFLQCLHWEGLHSAWAFVCIFRLFPLENVWAHSSHAESLSPVSSGHMDLQTLPTWENFCTTSAFVSTFSRNKAFTQLSFHVHLQVVSTRKQFSTYFTFRKPFSRK